MFEDKSKIAVNSKLLTRFLNAVIEYFKRIDASHELTEVPLSLGT